MLMHTVKLYTNLHLPLKYGQKIWITVIFACVVLQYIPSHYLISCSPYDVEIWIECFWPSPDLVSSDYHLFFHIKQIAIQSFVNDDKLMTGETNWLKSVAQIF